MVRTKDVLITRENDCIVKMSNGQRQVIVDLGDVVYVSEGTKTGYGRHILRNGNVWMDSQGTVYIWSNGLLTSSKGRVWTHIFKPDDADMVVKSDV